MVFWRRLSLSKLKHASHQIERCCLQASPGLSRHYIAPTALSKSSSFTVIRRRDDLGFCISVRFFATPFQAKQKVEEKGQSGRRINEQIKASEVRVVTDEGHYIVPYNQALQEAKRLKLDLVEVQRDANPPVVKIMDYHMVRYKRQLRQKERAKERGKSTLKRGVIKEVRFTVKTESKDLAVKADGVKRLMDSGYRVKVMATGTEDQDLGGLLARMVEMIGDVAHIESGPRVERRQAFVVVRHEKFESKKGGKKKKVDINAEIEQQKAALAQSLDSSSIPEEEETRPHESGSEENEEDEVDDSRLRSKPIFSADFLKSAQLVQPATSPTPQVTENRYAKKTEQSTRFPPRGPVDSNNRDQVPRESFGFDPRERTRMPSDTLRQDRPHPNFSRSSRAPPGETQRPDGSSPRDAGRNFGRFSNPRSNGSNE